MNNKIIKQLSLISAAMMGEQQLYFMEQGGGRVVKKEENLEEKARRERCEQTAIEKAKAKRERRAAKIRLLTRKEN